MPLFSISLSRTVLKSLRSRGASKSLDTAHTIKHNLAVVVQTTFLVVDLFSNVNFHWLLHVLYFFLSKNFPNRAYMMSTKTGLMKRWSNDALKWIKCDTMSECRSLAPNWVLLVGAVAKWWLVPGAGWWNWVPHPRHCTVHYTCTQPYTHFGGRNFKSE